MPTPSNPAGRLPALLAASRFALLAALAVLPAAAQDFAACVDELRREATARGIAGATFEAAMAGVEPDPAVLEAMEAQPEFTTPVWDYLATLVDERRIEDGRRKLAAWSGVLDEVERRFGVERHVVVAVWGVESNFGRNTGRRPLVRSLATTSCFGRRQPYFRGELMATLRILQDGEIDAESLRGSWAGAFGQTQFMPSTFQRLAVDFDGDGRRDIVGSVPDALASTANYLKLAGWQAGKPWGFEVRLPRDYDGPSGRRAKKPLAEWQALGIRRIDRRELAGEEAAALLLPAGARGPAFLVLRNFDAIYSYNTSESYAIAIAHLADRLRGGGSFRAAWPTDDPGLSRTERIELQQRLAARGFDVGEADGLIGPRTLEAVKAFQRSIGVQPDGYAGWRLLRALRREMGDGAGGAVTKDHGAAQRGAAGS